MKDQIVLITSIGTSASIQLLVGLPWNGFHKACVLSEGALHKLGNFYISSRRIEGKFAL